MTELTTFLMYEGKAEEAMEFYVSLFPDSSVDSIDRYGPNEDGATGTVRKARFSLGGRKFICIDSPPIHEFGFTPSVSIFVTCDTAAEIDRLYASLSDGGQVLMPLDVYPFAERYTWIADRYGLSWQLILGEK